MYLLYSCVLQLLSSFSYTEIHAMLSKRKPPEIFAKKDFSPEDPLFGEQLRDLICSNQDLEDAIKKAEDVYGFGCRNRPDKLHVRHVCYNKPHAADLTKYLVAEIIISHQTKEISHAQVCSQDFTIHGFFC